ncbi:MAG: hypothetical protein M1834_003074 [Cirrosporium novae-zelandiae]|nr:MAG: hypothetical protein M1834_003074 [Cirrosporium novae-zelandiae]
MAAAAVDIPQVATFCSVPESTLTTLLEAPTVELVNIILEKIATKAQEYEELKSTNVRLEVELENAVRSGESKARVLKGSVEKGLKETADLRAKLQEEENARSSLQTELDNLKSTSSTSISDASTLRSRIESLENSNRETLSLLEGKSTAYDKLAEDLSNEHQKIIELRKQVSALEQSLQDANSRNATAKFREGNLQQEIDMLKRNSEWVDNELKTKSAEFLKYRKEKSSQIAELQRNYDDAVSDVESLKRTENSLRSHITDLEGKYEESLAAIQQVEEEKTKNEENYRTELDSLSRLADLHKQSADTARQRLQECQSTYEKAHEKTAEEYGRIRAELATENAEKEAAERRISELEVTVDRLESELASAQEQGLPASPLRRSINGTGFTTPRRAQSPAGVQTPGSTSRPKNNLSMTQLYSEYSNVKAELFSEKKRSEKLSNTLDEMMHDLETRGPELEELKEDHERLQTEMIEMSSLVEEAGKEADVARKEARKSEAQVQGLVKESEVLRQQLRDLSAQIKILLVEVHARDQGLDGLSDIEKLELEKAARGEIDPESLDGLTDTGRFISQSLTTFKDIQELQEQNMKLLTLTRSLGDQMEGREAQDKKNVQEQEHQELLELRGKIERYKDELKSMITQSQSYIKERDMFRRMLTHRGQLPPGADFSASFGQSINGGDIPGTPPTVSVLGADGSPSNPPADYAKLVKEMQQHFDAYRQEAATDHSALKEQVNNLSKKNGELQSEASRSNGQLRLAQERHEMLQTNYNFLKAENSQLQKRSQSLSENSAKQELRAQQLVEETFEIRSLLDSVRNETANLKAEKEVWKGIEKRLVDDNESLRTERSRLNTLTNNLQNLINERELSESENRRRFQSQIEALESELQTTKRRLNDEIEDGKKAALRREYDNQQSQKRIDDLTSGLSTAREELIAAKTSRDHLQARVDELTVELRSAEERAQVLQPKPTPRPAAQASTATTDATNTEESSITREQELAVEVSELKRDLDLAKVELENAKEQIEQYKSISQSSEEELQSLNEASDQYRAEMDQQIENRDNRIRELEQRVEEITTELSTTNSQLTALRDEQAEHTRKLEEQKSTYEAEIARLKDEDDRHATAAQYHQEDLRAQAEIAQQAQQNYENELLKHAEAAKALQKTRTENTQLRTEKAEWKAKAESVETTLAQQEESFRETNAAKDRTIMDLSTRKSEIEEQNKRLYQQIEESSQKQLDELRQSRILPSEDQESAGSPVQGLDNLQEVIKYLRREKEIVDVQLELATQEGTRVRQKLEYTQSQLDEARVKLDQQRRSELDAERSALNHNKLMETINELNLFRESSVTLRNEARQAQTALAEKSKEYDELRAQIDPKEAYIRELESDKEAKQEEIKLVKEDRDRYQQRIQTILQKYDRIDPAEMEALKEKITTLEAERDQLLSEKEALQAQANEVEERIKQAEETARAELRSRLTDQFKARSRSQTERIKAKEAELQQVVQERDTIASQLNEIKQQLDTAIAERDAAIANAQSTQETTNPTPGTEEGQIEETSQNTVPAAELETLEKKLADAEQRANDEAVKTESLTNELTIRNGRITELEGQLNVLQQNIHNLNGRISQLSAEKQQAAVNQSQNAESHEELDRVRKELAEARQEVESLRTTASINAAVAGAPEDGQKSMADQITEQVDAIRAELEKRHDERVKQAEERFDGRADRMRTQLSQKLTDGKASIRQQLATEHQQAMKQLESQYQKEMEDLKTRHKEEMDELRRNEEVRFEQFKRIHAAETQPSNGTNVTPVKGETQAPASTKPDVSTLSREDIQRLLEANPSAKEIFSRNVQKHFNLRKDNLISQVKEEQEKIMTERLVEAERKANSDKAQAVQLSEKRTAVKLSMTETRSRNANAKLEVIQKAAQETPEKPVGEVWSVAKDAKAPPVIPQPKPQTSIPHIPQQAASPAQPNSTSQQQPKQQAPSQGMPGQLTPASTSSPVGSGARVVSISAPAPVSTLPATPIHQTSSAIQQPVVQSHSSTQPTTQPNPFQPLPSKPSPVQQTINHHSNAGTGPGALRGLLQNSGLPQVRGGARGGRGGQFGQQSQIPSAPHNQNQNQQQRGSGLPRGRGGRGGPNGRGGAQHIQTGVMQQGGQIHQQSPQSARGGPLNASAKQFIPGAKRGRDEGDIGQLGNQEKRMRAASNGN